MIVCLCRAVSDTTLRKLVDEGVCSLDEIREACQAGTECGACLPQLARLVAAPTRRQGRAESVSSETEPDSESLLDRLLL